MSVDVFNSVVVPSVEQVPLLEVTQDVETEGLVLKASYEIEQTVLTEFDRRLSDHLAATKGAGFPTISLTITITDPSTDKSWTPVSRQYFPALPHALQRIAEFALGNLDRCPVTLFARSRKLAGPQAFGKAATLSRAKLESLSAAIAFCDMLGEYEFLHVTGHFDSLVVQPTDKSMGSVIIDLERAAINFPGDMSGPGYVCPLFNPKAQISQNREATNYITRLHHNLALAKEQAIWTFRSVAEERIFGFDKALAGQPLSDYRLTAAETLVNRLRAGLGDNLLGLSEQAQITALGWARLITRARDTSRMIEGRESTPKKPPEGAKSSSPIRLITSD